MTPARHLLTMVLSVLCLAPAMAAGTDVRVGRTRIVMREAISPFLMRFPDGTIILDTASSSNTRAAVVSRDGGRTWNRFHNTLLHGIDGSLCQLHDETALVFDYHTQRVEGKRNLFTTGRRHSTDQWANVSAAVPITVEMPGVIPSVDDGGTPYDGPLFHGRAVAMPDGSILTTMYGKFAADSKFSKPGENSKSRSVLVRSTDRGLSWKLVSTIASLHGINDPELLRSWQEGFGEPSLARLPNGKLVCVMRTGTRVKQRAVDTYEDLSRTIERDGKFLVSSGESCRPIYQATSTDGGQTWSPPRPVPQAMGACPRLLVLDCGLLALSFGRLERPSQGVAIMLSSDGGETWGERTVLFPGLTTGYTDMVPLGPRKLLLVHDSVTAWGPKYAPDWTGAIDMEVQAEPASSNP